MIEKTIEFCVQKKFLVLVVVLMLSVWGYRCLQQTPLDAIPNLSDVQVIVFTEWAGKSPDIIEDQITYPIVSSMVAAPISISPILECSIFQSPIPISPIIPSMVAIN